MTGNNTAHLTSANLLCQACGLCCTGHLFIWVKLRPAELDPAEALGMQVFRSDPQQRGFGQPCPLWQGQCTIYTTTQYPHACRAYKCKLLKELLAEQTTLPAAIEIIAQSWKLIREVEKHLPASDNPNFRERLVELIEHPEKFPDASQELQQKAGQLLQVYEQTFGVNDLIEKPIRQG